MESYDQLSVVLKALADPKRLKIVALLSKSVSEPFCACDVLSYFNFTQPTLSHHMKLLENAGIVKVVRKRQWHQYSLQEEFVQAFLEELSSLLLSKTTVS